MRWGLVQDSYIKCNSFPVGTKTTLIGLCALVVASLGLTACSSSPRRHASAVRPTTSSSTAVTPTATTTTPSPTTTTVSPVVGEVLRAWRYDQSTIESAYRQANVNDPMVGTAATGPYLKSILGLLYQEQHAGWVGMGTDTNLHPRVSVQNLASAYVTWCQWGDLLFVGRGTRKPVAGLAGEPGYALVRAHLVYTKDYQGESTWLMRRSVNIKLQTVSGPNVTVERQVCGTYA